MSATRATSSLARAGLARGRALAAERARERLEDYVWLTRGQGLTLRQAAGRLDICTRTAERYEARLRRQRQDVAA